MTEEVREEARGGWGDFLDGLVEWIDARMEKGMAGCQWYGLIYSMSQ